MLRPPYRKETNRWPLDDSRADDLPREGKGGLEGNENSLAGRLDGTMKTRTHHGVGVLKPPPGGG